VQHEQYGPRDPSNDRDQCRSIGEDTPLVPLTRLGRRFPIPSQTVPVMTGQVLAEEDFGGDRLLVALDQIQQLGPPSTIAGWNALAEEILVDERCVVDRNRQISSCYAWAYMALPSCFKWAGMAAIASHHVRVALLPLHLQTAFKDSSGHMHRPERCRVLTDVNTIRATNNDIFDDLFWVHLAYVTSENGIKLLRALLRNERRYAPVLAGFEVLDDGRRVLEDVTASLAAQGKARDLVWKGTLLLLEHEQRSVVQPNFDRLSCMYAWVISIGSASTFDSRRPCRAKEFFTSFYLYTLVRSNPRGLGGRVRPLINDYDDRWRWLVSSVVPRFQRVDTDPHVIRAILRRVLDQARGPNIKDCAASVRREDVVSGLENQGHPTTFAASSA
jgi:hypothetical protein